MKKSIEEYSDQELFNLENNYISKNLTEGGIFSLYEIRLEILNRGTKEFSGKFIVEKIIELIKNSEKNLITYGALWESLNPGKPWKGNDSQRRVGKYLGKAVYYCIQNRLPIYTCAVVNGNTNALTEKAIQNIFNECTRLGMDTGPIPGNFVENQMELIREAIQ